jgi:hypothetical protein
MSKARDNVGKLNGIVSANEARFGIKGDGVTDDTAAIEACIAGAGASATIIYPPGFNMKITSEVDFNVAGQRHVGYGATFTKDAAFVGSGMLRVAATNVHLEGFTLAGTDKADDGVILSGGSASGFVARRLTIRQCNYGISANSNSNVTLEENDIAETANYSIRCHNTAATAALSGLRVVNNRLDRSDTTAATVTSGCLLVRGDVTYVTSDVVVTGNRMIHVADPTNSAAVCCEMRYVNGGTFSNNYGKDGSMLVSVALAEDVTVDGNVCDGATFYGIEVAGISPTGMENIVVSNNAINGRGRLNYGIGLQGTQASTGCVVSGNSIRGTVLYGIFSNHQWDNLVISNNRIDITAVSANQYGIYLLGNATQITNVTITGNHVHGNGVGEKAIYLRSIVYASVTGNVCPDWTQNGVYIDGADASCDEISIVGNSFKGLTAGAIAITGTVGSQVRSSGNTGYRRTNTTACNDIDLASNIFDAWGNDTPEGAVTAGISSTFRRLNGGASTSLYIKESGTGNTGWRAV